MSIQKTAFITIVVLILVVTHWSVSHSLIKCICDGEVLYTNTQCPCPQKNEKTNPSNQVFKSDFSAISQANDVIVKYEFALTPVSSLDARYSAAKSLVEELDRDNLPISLQVRMSNRDGSLIGTFLVEGEIHKERA